MKYSSLLYFTLTILCFFTPPSLAKSMSNQCVSLSVAEITVKPWNLWHLLYSKPEQFRVDCDGEDIGSVEITHLNCMVPEDRHTQYSKIRVGKVEIRYFNPEYLPETIFFETFENEYYTGWGHVSLVPNQSTLDAKLVSKYCGVKFGEILKYSARFTVEVESISIVKMLIEMNREK